MPRLKLAFLGVCRALGLFRVSRALTRRRLRIVCYHGFELDDESEFQPKLFIKPDTFAARLDLIERMGFRVLSLDEGVEGLYAGTLPDDALVITIDDGFHSVFARAAKALRERGFPATVYVTTYYVEHPNPVFRLAVQYMFWKSERRALDFSGLDWARAAGLEHVEGDDVERALWACIEHGEHHCSEPERQALCEALGQRLGVPYSSVVAARPVTLMTPGELRALRDMGIVVELHTHRHVFPGDDRRRAEAEIRDNERVLSNFLGRRPRHFCYPSGQFQETQWPWLDELGVLSSTTCLPGLNTPRTPRHGLRRLLDGENLHALEVESELSGFSDAYRSLKRALRHG